MENTQTTATLWADWCSPPDYAKKRISGGRLSGLTDISPMWRIKVLTDKFGLCGVGWRFAIAEKWTEECAGEIIANVRGILTIIIDGKEYQIEGFGGAKLTLRERSGVYVNDEAWKMASTDALSVCCKMLGIGADVYMDAPATKYMTQTDTTKNDAEKSDEKQDDDKTDKKLEAFSRYIQSIDGWREKLSALGYDDIAAVPEDKRRQVYQAIKDYKPEQTADTTQPTQPKKSEKPDGFENTVKSINNWLDKLGRIGYESIESIPEAKKRSVLAKLKTMR